MVLDGEGREAEAAQHMRRLVPHASPNRRIIALADRLLKRDGRLIAARAEMGPASPFPPPRRTGLPRLAVREGVVALANGQTAELDRAWA
jgi:hypothetical protein